MADKILRVDMDRIPAGYEPVVAFVRDASLVLPGEPEADRFAGHNCDYRGCGSLEHVRFRCNMDRADEAPEKIAALARHLAELQDQGRRHAAELKEERSKSFRHSALLEKDRAVAARACITSLFLDACKAGDEERVSRILDLAPFMKDRLEQTREAFEALAPPVMAVAEFICPLCEAKHRRGPVNLGNAYRCLACGYTGPVVDEAAPPAGDAGDTGGTYGPAGEKHVVEYDKGVPPEIKRVSGAEEIQ